VPFKKSLLAPLIIFVICIPLLVAANNIRPPGAAVYPRLLLQAIMIMSAILIIGGLRKEDRQAKEDLQPVRAMVILGLCCLYGFLVYLTGFYIATSVFLAAAMSYLGMDRYLNMALIILGINFISWLVFANRLHVMFPKGIIFK
jgi:hypothetical protein